MKTIWTVLSVLAVANLLAVTAFVGWLRSSERLDMERVRQVRELLQPTITEVKAKAELARAEQVAQKKKQEEEAKAARAPLTASEQLEARLEANELDRQRVKSLKTEVESLRRSLRDAQEQIRREREELARKKDEYDRLVASQQTLTGSEQFKKTLAVLESFKPSDARVALMQIMGGAGILSEPAPEGVKNAPETTGDEIRSTHPTGADSKVAQMSGKTRVIEYLNAMDEKVRARVMTEFVRSDPRLAGELLESLRTHGQVAAAFKATAP